MILRPWALVASIGCVLVMGGGACSSSSSSGSGGQGGTAVPTGGTTVPMGGATGTAGTTGAAGGATGTAGSSGVAGTNGAAGGASGVVSCGNMPACVASILETCPLAASDCGLMDTTTNPTMTTIVATQDICFANGVKVQKTVMSDLDAATGSETITVLKNGAPCFSLDGTFSSVTNAPQVLSFKDTSGIEVATFSTDGTTFPATVTVTCDAGPSAGQPVAITDFGNCGIPSNPEPDYCPGRGHCTYP